MSNSIDVSKCTGCGTCFKTCGLDVFRLDTEQPVLSPAWPNVRQVLSITTEKIPPTVFTALLGGPLRMKWDKLLPKGRSCP